MPSTVGRVPGRTFLDEWVQQHGEAERRRVYGEPIEPESFEPDIEEPKPYRNERSTGAATAAIANAMGVEVGDRELDGLDFTPDPAYNASGAAAPSHSGMDATPDPIDPPDARPESRDSSRAYVVREGNWREDHGMPRRRKKVPPSRTPEARRLRHLQELVEAGKYASIHEAEHGARKRHSFGKPKRKPE